MEQMTSEDLMTCISVISLFFAWAAGFSKGGQR